MNLYTQTDVAGILGRSPTYIQGAMDALQMEPMTIGKSLVITEDQLDSLRFLTSAKAPARRKRRKQTIAS